MPHTKSAFKRHKQDEKRRLANKAVRSAFKSAVKKVEEAVQAGKLDEAKTLAAFAMKRIDKAAKARAIHPNAAAHRKSQVSGALNRAAAAKKA